MDHAGMSIMNVAKEAHMPHKPWKLLFSFWTTSLALAIVALFTLAVDSDAQGTLEPYAPPILHSFLDSASVYPESVTVDQSSGTFLTHSTRQSRSVQAARRIRISCIRMVGES